MSLKQKPTQLRQREYFERQLKDRLAFLSGKGIEPARAGKDPLVRKYKAGIRAAEFRLRQIAASEKLTEDLARRKAEKAAAAKREQESARPEKPKKAPEEAKARKPKPEKKPAAPKEPRPKGAEKEKKSAPEAPAEAPQEERSKE